MKEFYLTIQAVAVTETSELNSLTLSSAVFFKELLVLYLLENLFFFFSFTAFIYPPVHPQTF